MRCGQRRVMLPNRQPQSSASGDIDICTRSSFANHTIVPDSAHIKGSPAFAAVVQSRSHGSLASRL